MTRSVCSMTPRAHRTRRTSRSCTAAGWRTPRSRRLPRCSHAKGAVYSAGCRRCPPG
ncbi:MAG: hypothetical protein MZV64_10155 [Ignavibacteriales bacterium]|nr:hypothetical protein [Ignavibacteriales bacterium]